MYKGAQWIERLFRRPSVFDASSRGSKLDLTFILWAADS
jgi:hypothetical protein